MATARHEERLWQDHRDHLFRFVLRRVGDEATAEDIVHDVLVRAYQKRHTLRDAQKFEQWLFQITRNAVIDHYRTSKPSSPLPADLTAADAPQSRDVRQELAQCIRPLIQALPDHYRDAVMLSEVQGLTQKETAHRLGLSVSGAKSRVQRARRMLEEKLLDCCRVEFDSRGAIADYESRDGCTGTAGPDGAGCGSC